MAAVKKTGYFHRVDLLTSMVLVFPLFLIYQVGALIAPQAENGADLISRRLLSLLHNQVGTYLLVNAGLALAFAVTIIVLRRKNEFQLRLFIPVVVESSLYALLVGSMVALVLTRVLHVPPPPLSTGSSPRDLGVFAKIVVACGAGVHEELVFRLIMISAFTAIGEKVFGLSRFANVTVAFVLSATLFSAAHHIIGGDPFSLFLFLNRFLAGIGFALIYQLRGFAPAVYTHTLFDIFVLLLPG